MREAICVRDYVMADGVLAFRFGERYQWRFASEAELAELGAAFVFHSEIVEDHYMDFEDVREAFLWGEN